MRTPTDRKISQTPLMMGMDPLAELPAIRTGHRSHRGPGDHTHHRPLIEHLLDHQEGQARKDRPDQIARTP